MKHATLKTALVLGLATSLPLAGGGASAQDPAAVPALTYADLADLAGGAELVLRAEVKKQVELEPERAPNVPPEKVRLYIEAETQTLLAGSSPVGESLKYLVDVPRDSRGRAPKLKKKAVLLFARPVAGQPGALRLVAPDAQVLWDEATEQRLRTVLSQLVSRSAPPQVTGVRDAISISGTLVGESETQIFLETAGGDPVSITVVRRPGQTPQWGVSWSEIVDQSARPPAPETLEWYRLACFLPGSLDRSAVLSDTPADMARAQGDYRFVMEQLGPCPRNRS